MPAPKKGQSVRGSRTGRPIMVLLDVLGRRWALRVLWELRGGLPMTFRELRAASGELSPSVLNDRLAELRELGLVDHAGDGYVLTRDGLELGALLAPLDAWARRWAARRER